MNLSFNKENVTNIVVLPDGTVEETIIIDENGQGDASTPMITEEGELPETTSKKLVKVNLNKSVVTEYIWEMKREFLT